MADAINKAALKEFGEEILVKVAELISVGVDQRKKEKEVEEEKPPKVSLKGIQKNIDFNFKIKNVLSKAMAADDLENGVKEVLELIKSRNGELLLLDSDPNLLQTKEKLDALKAISGGDSEGSSTQADMTSILLLSNLTGIAGNKSGDNSGFDQRVFSEAREILGKMEAKVMEAETAREASAATNAKDMGTMPMIVNNEETILPEPQGLRPSVKRHEEFLIVEIKRLEGEGVVVRVEEEPRCVSPLHVVEQGDIGVAKARWMMQVVGENQKKKSESKMARKNKSPGEEKEIEFWRARGAELLRRNLLEVESKPDLFLYTDASARGIGGLLKNERQDILWKMTEIGDGNFEKQSSAWRELTAVEVASARISSNLKGRVQVLVDSQAAVSVLRRGSMKPELHSLAERVWHNLENVDIPSLERAESTSSSTSREQSEWDFLEGPKKDYIEEIERQAGKEFQTHLDKLKAAPLESKASSTALAYKAENKRRKDWIIEKRLPLNESSFLLYLVDRAKGIGSSALSKISAAYQAAIFSFHVMLRASEAAEIKWEGVTQKDGMIEVHVEKAKNDQWRLGRSSFFNYDPGSDADILMCRWRIHSRGKCPYVFSNLDGSKKLTKSSISALATKMLAAIGKSGATHHAFRRGGANHMRATGYSMEEIQARGRWRSLAGLQRYIKDVPRAQGCLHPQENGIGVEEDDEDFE
ncbi:Protein CBG24943 [Caenorhabditis briggsae]|uniref:Protein CBG24943 n=1 Tax=Caenorhabditis briggsae TaxID=6238 RepID=A8WLT7_CAEBR|nr:Protein CBG24943 [Caenorhabditis briggsae]CAP21434.1 Protein CBG24943 [Caenorhabditis briggsae]